MARESEEGNDLSVFDFKEDEPELNPGVSVDRKFFAEMFSRKHKERDAVTGNCGTLTRDGSICSREEDVTIVSNAEAETDDEGRSLEKSTSNEVSNNDNDESSSADSDKSSSPQHDMVSEDEEMSEMRNSSEDSLQFELEEEGQQKYCDPDLSDASDPYDESDDEDDMECADGDVILYPEFGWYGDQFLMMPELKFCMESVTLLIKNPKSSLENIHSFNWVVTDIEYIKTHQFSPGDVGIVIVALKDHCVDELGTVFGEVGEKCISFVFNGVRWQEQFLHLLSLNEGYKSVWKSMHEDSFSEDLSACKWLSETNELEGKQCSFVRLEETVQEFIFPTGDPDAVSISGRDIDLLQMDTFINDTLVDFYIKYLQTTIPESQRQYCHFFNSFFFRKLADLDKYPETTVIKREAFLRVRKWTRKVDIFNKGYIFIPVNYCYHWSVVIVCNPGGVVPKDDTVSISPCILHLDSLSGTHASLKTIIQSYLWEEWRERNHVDEAMAEAISQKFFNVNFLECEVPQQDNGCDCGLFLLHYVERFLREAPQKIDISRLRNSSRFLTRDWFFPAEASVLKRCLIRELIFKLYNEAVSASFGANQICKESSDAVNAYQEAECAMECENSVLNLGEGTEGMVLNEETFEIACIQYDGSDPKADFKDDGAVQHLNPEPMQTDENINTNSNQMPNEQETISQLQVQDHFENELNKTCLNELRTKADDLDEDMTETPVINEMVKMDSSTVVSETTCSENFKNLNNGLDCSISDRNDDEGSKPLKKLKVIDKREFSQGSMLTEENWDMKKEPLTSDTKEHRGDIQKIASENNLVEEELMQNLRLPYLESITSVPLAEFTDVRTIQEAGSTKDTNNGCSELEPCQVQKEPIACSEACEPRKESITCSEACKDGKEIINCSEACQDQIETINCLEARQDQIESISCSEACHSQKESINDDIVTNNVSSEPCDADRQLSNTVAADGNRNAVQQMFDNGVKAVTEETDSLDPSKEFTEAISDVEGNEHKESRSEDRVESTQDSLNDITKEPNINIIDCSSSPEPTSRSPRGEKTPKSGKKRKRNDGRHSNERPRTRSVTRNAIIPRPTRVSGRRQLHPYGKQ